MPYTPMGQLSGEASLTDIRDYIIRLERKLDFLQRNLDTENIFEVGGWRVTKDLLASKDGDVGMSTADTFSDDVRYWAGSTDMSIAPFRVHKSGKVYTRDLEAVDSTITGASIIGATITGGTINVTTDLYIGSNIYMSGSGFFDGRVQFGNEFCYIRGNNNTIDLIAFNGVFSNGGEIATKDWVNTQLSGKSNVGHTHTVTVSGTTYTTSS